jgi:hypothetical protein
MQLWNRGQNVANASKYPNLITWPQFLLFFQEFFEILAPSTYLHLKTFPIGFSEKKPKTDVTFKNMGKML